MDYIAFFSDPYILCKDLQYEKPQKKNHETLDNWDFYVKILQSRFEDLD